MNKQKKHQLFASLGLFFLVGEILLLFYKTKQITDHLVFCYALLLTIFFSLSIVYLTFREIQAEKNHADKREKISADRLANIAELLKETHALYKDKIRHLEGECEKIQHSNTHLQNQHEKNLEEWRVGQEQQLEEISSHKVQCQSLQDSLNDAMDELRASRQECFLLKEKESEKTQSQMSSQYKQLRDQFEEKSAILDAMRKDFFALESRYIALQKQQQFEMCENAPKQDLLIKQFQEMDQENKALEKEIETLEILVSKLAGKKSPVRRRKKAIALELQFEENSLNSSQ